MVKLISLIGLAFLCSCVYDTLDKIVVVRNNTRLNLVFVYSSDKINDSTLFFGRKYPIAIDTTQEIYGFRHFDSSGNICFWVFNQDSVYKQIRSGKLEGIVSKSLIKKIIFNNDSLKKHNDTLILKNYL